MIIDLRSDTVTKPTPEMRQAMADAEVGDDVYEEDPTVKRLEELAADRIGKAAALFLPTGTMANQVAALTHAGRGDEVITEAESHIYFYEVAGLAVLAGVQVRTIPGANGAMRPEAVEAAIRPENIHAPRTALICLENTHNRSGGTVFPQEWVEGIGRIARNHKIPIHMDGARIFNAALASGRKAAELAAPVDSIMFCLSKGLSAPVGSMLAGTKEFIRAARKNRKLLGGGMRQVGVLAAAGLVALETMIDRLAEDHANARRLAEGLAEIPGLSVDLNTVQTNIVGCDLTTPAWNGPALVQAMSARGVKTNAMGPKRVRFVTHKDVDRAGVDQALQVIAGLLKELPR